MKHPWLKKGDVQKPPQTFRQRLPTLEETQLILSIMRPFAQPLYRCLRLTGARPGELRRCRDHFGISKEIVLYTARHACASMMIDSGADISEVKVQLGHTDIGTTQRYVHPDERKVRKSVTAIQDVKVEAA